MFVVMDTASKTEISLFEKVGLTHLSEVPERTAVAPPPVGGDPALTRPDPRLTG